MNDIHVVVLVTLLILALYMFFTGMAGFARYKFGVKPPAITGHPEFERYLRVQQNTLEQIVIILPAMWLFAFLVSAMWASILGALWIVGRIIYAIGYYRDADKRHPGSLVGFIASLVLVVGSLVTVVMDLLKA